MRSHIVIPILAVAVLAIGALFGPTPPASRADDGESELFDPVFEIMDRPRNEGGCRGCHIGPEPRFGFWFGDDRESVLMTLETGINPNGDVRELIPVEGGRNSILGAALHSGYMPLGGEAWDKLQLRFLDRWLRTYE